MCNIDGLLYLIVDEASLELQESLMSSAKKNPNLNQKLRQHFFLNVQRKKTYVGNQ